ncbi:5351_t:CDS:2, partial [Ambispora leptoticha]
MLLPSSATYESADELFKNVQSIANSQGYVLIKKRTRRDRYGNLKNMTLRCNRGGVYNSSGKLQRQTSTRLIDCPFELYAARYENLWHAEIRNSNHSHDPSEDLSGHPMVRRLTKQQLDNVKEMTASGSRTREIISTIRQNNPSASVISKDIYNACERLRQQNLAGCSPVKALIDELREGDYMYEYKCDNIGHITHLFFTHNESVKLTRRYPSVLLMDCTYKMNRFKMPLLDVVGITSFNTTFFSCFVFMKDEEEEDYLWALTCITKLFDGISQPGIIVTDRELALMNALRTTFSNSTHLLCLWHINKNIMKNCKPQFVKGTGNKESNEWQAFLSEWNKVVQSLTNEEFNTKWSEFHNNYTNKPNAWTNKFLHLGTTVTSRVEGAHSTIKTYLRTSAGDLRDVRIKISLAVENQKKEVDTMAASEKIRFPIFVQSNSLYANIKGRVSTFSLKKIEEQYQKIKNATTQEPLPPCTGSFSSTMRLPCAHKIQLLENNRSLILEDIYEHWWIQGRAPISI